MTQQTTRSWQRTFIKRLIDYAGTDGGWGYQSGQASRAEPTALACLALATAEPNAEAIQHGLKWLVRAQREDGAIPISPDLSAPSWPTSLAILAWLRSVPHEPAAFADNASRAVDWLLHTQGLTFKSNPSIYGHNTQLKGWPWVDRTHSWVEPTAYAILALRAARRSDCSRVREAVELLNDRAIPGGGWNYGNSTMFGNRLRPFPAQTGIALAALTGEPINEFVRAGLDFLSVELERIRTPMSFAWSVIGLTAWEKHLDSFGDRLVECASRLKGIPPHPALDSLLLLADAKQCPLITNSEALHHG